MDSDRKLCSVETDPGRKPNLVNPEFQSSNNANLGAEVSFSASLSRPSDTPALSNQGNHYHLHPLGFQHHNHLPHLHSEPLTMPDISTRSTSFSGPSSLPEAHASGSDPTGAPPIGATRPSHRNPYQHLSSHPSSVPSNLRRSSSENRLKKPGGEETLFSPPFLHPSSLRTKSSRAHSPFPASAQRSRDSKKPRTRFTVGSSRPNSPVEPMEPEPKHGYFTPKSFLSPFTIRGFLALSTFSKVVALSFVCCAFVLFKAFFGVGHSAESCGVFAHEVTNPGPRSGSSLGSPSSGLNANNPESRTKDGALQDQSEDKQAHVWLERVDEMYGYQYDWKLEEYEIEHDDDGDDRYDDEYEHEDFLDQA
ncbi:hypothetical protein BDM02DRAFT_3130465 [Thelephora ganbajun]|uniref:Uncharacterized protein n=1 Tax=Thelephora ganbajun TaxID=370292 RepID=A0ACB6Z9K0_THEGA|nr:hypothetical protein BDM02DRAFT_3130465 [Thelephora ganbajun]